jgi:hypothetical protein
MSKVPIPKAYKNGVPLLSHLQEPLSVTYDILVDQEDLQKTLSQRLLEIWNLEQAKNNSLRALLADAERVAAQSLLSPSDDASAYFFVGDTFDGEGLLDSNTTCYLDKEAGYMILPVNAIRDLNPYIQQVNILEESQGRPGDYVAVRRLEYKKDNSPNVEVSLDPHDDISDAFDGRPDTWYCWENIFIPKVQNIRRGGPQSAIIADPNGRPEDVESLMGGHGNTWEGLIPGQGTKSKSLFGFVVNAVLVRIKTIAQRTLTRVTNLQAKTDKKASLSLEIVFTEPVPLSAIRITPLIELNQLDPSVEEVYAYTESGLTAKPPGLPRRITSLSGRKVSVERASKSAIGRADYSGSGVFFVRSYLEGIKKVRVNLTAQSSVLQEGAAHLFYVKNTETNEKVKVLGFTTKNKTTRGQERIAGPGGYYQEKNNTTGKNLFTGPLGNLFSLAKSFVQDKRTKDFADKIRRKRKEAEQYDGKERAKMLAEIENEISQQRSFERTPQTIFDRRNLGIPPFNTKNRSLNDFLNRGVDSLLNNSGLREPANTLRESAEAGIQIGQLVGGKIGAALMGPVGIIAGAALTGNLYKKEKTTRVLSEQAGVDILAGERAAILIREMSFDSREFQELGEVSSTTLKLAGECRALNLFVQVDIPQDWPQGPWITAQIKAVYDDGESDWQNIKPQGFAWSGDSAPETITFPEVFTRVKVRILLRRPVGDFYINETPIFNSYVVKGLPA